MELGEVKEYFKDAEEVRCLYTGEIFDFNDMTSRGFHFFDEDSWFERRGDRGGKSCLLWNKEEGFAEIISYKTKASDTLQNKVKTALEAKGYDFENITDKELVLLYDAVKATENILLV